MAAATSRFCADWSPEQELRLLEGIEEFGYGNWPSVAIKVEKTPKECKQHYDRYYVSSLQYKRAEVLPLRRPGAARKNVAMKEEVSDHLSYYPGAEIVGYLPHRGDFVREPDNEAEYIIADLNPDPEDEDVVTALHLEAINVYQSRLADRARKKRIIRDYGLLDIQKQIAVEEARLTHHQLRVKKISRPFLRFMSPLNAAKFLQSHYLEATLADETKKLQEYRRNGIRTFKGVSLYERLLAEKKRIKSCREAAIKKTYSMEENLLFQILNHNSLKPKARPVAKETKLLDITYSVGIEKLEGEEKELCSLCRFQPESYLQFKELLLSEHKKSGKLLLADARKLLKIDVNKTRKIYDFLKGKGLLVASTGT